MPRDLPNNCRLSNINILPENWNKPGARLNDKWEISYRFYDDNLNENKPFRITSFKKLKTVKDRQDFIKKHISDIENLYFNKGFNPITGREFKPVDTETNSSFTFKSALQHTCKTMKVEHNTKIDIESVLRYIYPAIDSLGFANIPIEQVSRKHIKQTLEETGRLKVLTDIPIGKTGKTKKGIWSPNQFNHSRKYLHKLFEDMIELEMIENNPVHKVKKEDVVEDERLECTPEELEKIDKHLGENYPEFYRYYMIFRYSSSRIIETLRIKKEHVDLSNNRFKVLVKKGRKSKWAWRTILPEVDKHWEYLYNLAKPGEYIFGEGLLPQAREKPIRRDQITRRWEDHVKIKLGVMADIYSLKHTNLDEIAEKTLALQESSRMAQRAAGHSTSVITEKHYLKGHKKREHELLRKIAMN